MTQLTKIASKFTPKTFIGLASVDIRKIRGVIMRVVANL